MKNYKKLLIAGLAIVPLALSSWTSAGINADYANENQVEVSSIELIGNTAASSVVTTKTEKTVFSQSSVKTTDVVESKVAIVQSPTTSTLSFSEIVNNYK